MIRDPNDSGRPDGNKPRRVRVDLRWGTLPDEKQVADTIRTVYVFVSSTFRGMHAERDYLSQVVFPQLRSVGSLYGVHIDEIDLRAGVTEWLFASGSDPKGILQVCRQQIERCRPFFICLLGQRYGTTVGQIGRSITHLEVDHAIARSDQEDSGVLFFFRDPLCLDGVPPELRDAVYVETDPAAVNALDGLKQTIRQHYENCLVCDGYSARWDSDAYDWPTAYEATSPVKGRGRLVGLEDFGDTVKRSLWSAIRHRLNLPQEPSLPFDPCVRERNEHGIFAANLSEGYVLRHSLQSHLAAAVESGGATVLLGGVGSGKTALLAALTRSLVKENHAAVVAHFVGAAPFSKSLPHTLWRLAGELERLSGIRRGAIRDSETFDDRFARAIARLPRDIRVAIIVDGIDEFAAKGPLDVCDLIPVELPPNIAILVSCAPGGVAQGLMQCGHRIMAILPLSLAEREELLHRQSLLSKRLLGPDARTAMLQSAGASHPLFLRLAAPYVFLNAIDYESSSRLCTDVASMASPDVDSCIGGITNAILAAVENRFSTETMANLFSFLCSTRRALDEVELHEVMTTVDPYSNQLLPVLFALRRYLPRRGTRIEPLHRAFLTSAANRYAPSEDAMRLHRQAVANYYLAKPNWVYPEGPSKYRVPDFRKMEELPGLLRQVGMKSELQELIRNDEWREIRRDWLGPVAAREDLVSIERGDEESI